MRHNGSPEALMIGLFRSRVVVQGNAERPADGFDALLVIAIFAA
jgi:hypothetical protein